MPLVVVGALAAGVATTAFAVSATTVAMVGLGATVIGKVTKSKELSQLGAGLSLGAGISSVASSVFGTTAAAGTSAAAGTAEAGAGALENTISSADLAGIDAAAGGVGGSTPGALSISTSWDAPATAIEAAGNTGGLPASVTNSSGLLGSSSAPAGSLAATPQAPVQNVAAAPGAPAASSAGAIAPPPGTDTNSISQWWAKQPDGVKAKILQMGGSAVGGLFDGWSAEQKQALERERLNLEQQKYNTAMANGSAQPQIAFQAYKPQATGLLGSTKG